ncbi:MAG: LuxR C-terminal-related transcriptional regulator [Thermoleophilaceae bacterium]
MSTFIGRATELELLGAVVEQASSGSAAAVVIGEPGSGKSRLLAEAQARAALPQSLGVTGYEPERLVPLAAAAGLLRTLTEVPREGARLEALLFDPDEATALDPVRVFEAAHRAFRVLDFALLVIDDLHWMDELSYALCHYLIRAARDAGQRVAVLAASRPVEGGIALLDTLPRDRVRLIELGPLSREEGVELACGLDASLDRARAAHLYELARGSPFWLGALTRTRDPGEGPRELLTVRLRGAGPDAGVLLRLLAIVGRPLPAADLAALVGWPPERVRAALDDLSERGIAQQTTGAARLVHDLIREAVLADVPEDARRRIHRSFAEWLEHEAGADLRTLREALEHRRRAGLPTLELALRLVRSRGRMLLGADGLRDLAAIADEADPLDEDALALQQEIASLASDVALHEEALAIWLVVADRADARRSRASALLAASKAAYALERVAEAREFLAHSRRVEAADDVLSLEQVTHDAAICLWLEQRTGDGRSLARDAVAAAKRLLGSADLNALDRRARHAYVDALRLDYEAAMQEGDAAALLCAAEDREAAARGLGLESQLTASLAVATGLRLAGSVNEAVVSFRRLWAEAQRNVLPRLAVDAGYWLARSLEMSGKLAEAESVIQELTELAARAGDVPRARHRIARAACGIALERGRPRDALRQLAREAATEPNVHQRIAFHQDLAVWNARLAGSAAAAVVEEQLAAARSCAEAAGCPRCSAELLLFSAEALARAGDAEAAKDALARWDSLRMRDDALNDILRLRAGALAESSATARASALDDVLAAAERSPYALEANWVRLDLGLALAEVSRDRAILELEGAADAARELGAETVRELAERALRSLGVRTWRRDAVGAQLTEREYEVARLVADGATNREVAEALFLSSKTIERHLSNVFKKVGAHNRTQLAARLRDQAVKDGGNAR